MKIKHTVHTTLDLPLGYREGLAFVQAVEWSLSRVRFMRNLRLSPLEGQARRVQAEIPLTLPLVGPYDLRFESRLEPTPRGAVLGALPLSEAKKGWAEVAGEAEVSPQPAGSSVSYRLDITVHVDLPEPERWGGRALLKMVELTAQRVIADITQDFPKAVREAADAAHEAEQARRTVLN